MTGNPFTNRGYRRGFFIIEAMLAIVLFSMVQIYQTLVEQDEIEDARAEELGKDLAEVLYAIDKRVLLDGRVDQTINPSTGVLTKGDWNATWSTTQQFFDNMLGEQLIAVNHPTCGQPTGWSPKSSDNNALALINCYLMNETATPFGFEFEGSRSSINAVDTHVLGEWSFIAYLQTDDEFDDNFKYFGLIRNKAELYNTLEMTGQHQVTYVDRTLPNYPELASVRDCIAAKSACAIQFKYRVSQIGENANDPYVKVDGSTPLVGDLKFRTTSANPEQCFKADGSNVDCGFDFDLTNGQLDLHANSMTANEFKLIYENGGTPVVTVCPDWDNTTWNASGGRYGTGGEVATDTTCGISVINESGSTVAIAHLNKIYADAIIAEAFETSGDILVRKSLDPSNAGYDDYMRFANNGISYYKDGVLGSEIRLDNGIEILADGNLQMSADNATITSSAGINLSAQTVTVESDNFNLKTTTDQTPHINSPYIADQMQSAVATEAMLYDGVTIVGMDIVQSNSSVAKKTCPATSTGGRPTLRAITYPASGFYTNDKSVGRICDTTSSEFISLSVTPSVSRIDTNYAIDVTAVATLSGRIGCDPARDTSVSYRLDTSGSNWIPRMYFYGGNQYASQPADMIVMQYCDYTK